MSKLTRFEKSQKAHQRLKIQHTNSSSLLSRIKAMYHGEVEFEQRWSGRVLTKKERKDKYNRVNSFYQKGVKKGKTPKQLDLDYMLTQYNPFE